MAKKSNKEVPAAVEPETPVVVKAIKAFNSDFKCNDFQYEVGKSYEITGELKICRNGFHACDQSPFDVWEFYPVVDGDGKLTRYAQTSHSGDIQSEKDDNHSKIASAQITIDAEISLPDFIRRAVAWAVDAAKGKMPEASGDSAQIGSSGDSAKIGSSGDSAKIGSSGDYAKIGSSGYSAKIGSSGDSAQIGSSGYSAKIGSSGDSAQIGSSGDSAQIVSEGKDSVIATAGNGTRVSSSIGTWISVAEFNDGGKCIGFATGCIGKDGLEPGVFYVAKGGKLTKA